MNPETSRSFPRSPQHAVAAFVGWLFLTFAASLTGYFVSSSGEWYGALEKPVWTPPSWVFGPAWTTLYVLMAVAAWLVWREGGWARQARPLALFLAQWALNALWTPLFFGLQAPGWAFLNIVFLWFAIAGTIVLFGRVRLAAGLLLLPYLLWVSFAAALNFAIWRLNV